MGRLSAIFVAFCMVLIAGSVGVVAYLSFAFTGMEAAVLTTAVMTALAMINSIGGRQSDRSNVGAQIADLSRGTADIARQVSELDRRLVAMEGEMGAIMDRSRAATEPLTAEIGELGELVKDLADAVAAHEQMLESAIRAATPVRPMAAHAPIPAPAVAPAPTLAPGPAFSPEPLTPRAAVPADVPELAEAAAPSRMQSGYFKGIDQAEVAAQLARAIEANRVDLYLQPIVTLPQRKVRYYEALARLRADDGTLLSPEDFLDHAAHSGLIPAIDNLMVFRCVQVVRRLSTKNREVGLFCNMSAGTLANATVFKAVTDFLEANRALAPYLVFEFEQAAVREMGPIEEECLASLADLGFRFSMDHVADLRMEPRELSERGFRFVKVPAALLLNRMAPQGDIHPADFSDLLGRFGIDMIAEKIESEGTVVDLLDYDVRFGQGFLFSPPRPVRAEVLQGIAERPPVAERERAAPAERPVAPQVRLERPAPPPGAEIPQPPEPRPGGDRRATAIAQLARGIARRAQGA